MLLMIIVIIISKFCYCSVFDEKNAIFLDRKVACPKQILFSDYFPEKYFAFLLDKKRTVTLFFLLLDEFTSLSFN